MIDQALAQALQKEIPILTAQIIVYNSSIF